MGEKEENVTIPRKVLAYVIEELRKIKRELRER